MSRITKVAAVMAGTGALLAGGAGLASADAGAQGAAIGSPGVLSAPRQVPASNARPCAAIRAGDRVARRAVRAGPDDDLANFVEVDGHDRSESGVR
ncbi:hypothetical protein SMICM304S_10456 [Streptomyces microflavus]